MATMLLGNLNTAFQKVNTDVVLNYTKGANTSSPLGNWLKNHIPIHIVLERRVLTRAKGVFAWEWDNQKLHICASIPEAIQVNETETINLGIKPQLQEIANQMRSVGKRSILLSYVGGGLMNLTYTAFRTIVDEVFPSNEFDVYIFASSKYTPYHTGGEIIDFGTFQSQAANKDRKVTPKPQTTKAWIETIGTSFKSGVKMQVKRRPTVFAS